MQLKFRLYYPANETQILEKKLKVMGIEEIALLDANIVIDMIPIEKEKQIAFYKNKGLSEALAVRRGKMDLEYSKLILKSIEEWKSQKLDVISAITDFTLQEIEHKNHKEVRRYLKKIEGMNKGAFVYLKTPFSKKKFIQGAVDLLPKPLKHYALKYFKVEKKYSRGNDISLFYIASSLNEKSNITVGIVSRDKELEDLIKVSNQLYKKPLQYYWPNEYVRQLGMHPRVKSFQEI